MRNWNSTMNIQRKCSRVKASDNKISKIQAIAIAIDIVIIILILNKEWCWILQIAKINVRTIIKPEKICEMENNFNKTN